MIFLLQAGFLLMPVVNEHSVLTTVQHSPAMIRISSVDDSVGWITKFL